MPRKKKKSEDEEKKSEDAEVKAKEKEKEKKEEKKKEKWKKITRRQITVDFWRTSLHGEKIGVRQKDQQRAKSRQFSKDMELYGEIRFGKEESGHIGFRSTEWLESDISKGQIPRLVVRFFDDNDRWVASIEENTIQGLMLSLAYNEPMPVFNIFIKGVSNVYTMMRIEEGMSDRMVVPLILEKDGNTVDFFIFNRKQFTMGDDWEIYRPSEKKKILADLDSKKLDIGGKVEINIYDPELVKNKIFVNTLIMFASIIKFWGEVKDTLKDVYKKYKDEAFDFKPSRHELDLLQNPRRYAR